MAGSDRRRVGALDAVVFLFELMMLAEFAVAGARLGSDAAAVALAVILPLLVAMVWGLRLAPRARRRLPHPWRLAAKLGLLLAGAGLLAAAGATGWAIAFFVPAGIVVTSAEIGSYASRQS